MIFGDPIVHWGRRKIYLYSDNPQSTLAYRVLKFRFGIAFGPRIPRDSKRIRLCNMVSNLAEFTVARLPNPTIYKHIVKPFTPIEQTGRWAFIR